MNKIHLLTFLIAPFCFSQMTIDNELSISKIDSLSNLESCIKIFDFGGNIKAEKHKKIGQSTLKQMVLDGKGGKFTRL